MKFVMKEAEKFQMKIQNMKDEGIQKVLALNAIFSNNIWQPIDLDVNMICYCYVGSSVKDAGNSFTRHRILSKSLKDAFRESMLMH